MVLLFQLWTIVHNCQFRKTVLFSPHFFKDNCESARTKEINKISRCLPIRLVFILCLRYHDSYKQNDILFIIPLVGNLSEIEKCLHLTTTMECNSFKYK